MTLVSVSARSPLASGTSWEPAAPAEARSESRCITSTFIVPELLDNLKRLLHPGGDGQMGEHAPRLVHHHHPPRLVVGGEGGLEPGGHAGHDDGESGGVVHRAE